MNVKLPPLSSTVTSVFDQFVKKLEAEEVLSKAARDALWQSLHAQKLDHEALRGAIFRPREPEP